MGCTALGMGMPLSSSVGGAEVGVGMPSSLSSSMGGAAIRMPFCHLEMLPPDWECLAVHVVVEQEGFHCCCCYLVLLQW